MKSRRVVTAADLNTDEPLIPWHELLKLRLASGLTTPAYGRFIKLVKEGLIPCYTSDLITRKGKPIRQYRYSEVQEAILASHVRNSSL